MCTYTRPAEQLWGPRGGPPRPGRGSTRRTYPRSPSPGSPPRHLRARQSAFFFGVYLKMDNGKYVFPSKGKVLVGKIPRGLFPSMEIYQLGNSSPSTPPRAQVPESTAALRMQVAYMLTLHQGPRCKARAKQIPRARNCYCQTATHLSEVTSGVILSRMLARLVPTARRSVLLCPAATRKRRALRRVDLMPHVRTTQRRKARSDTAESTKSLGNPWL